MGFLTNGLANPAMTNTQGASISTSNKEGNSSNIIIIEQRALMRDLLKNWIIEIHQNFNVISVANAEGSILSDKLAEATMLIIGLGTLALSCSWFDRQVDWIRAIRADIPIVAILDADEEVESAATPLDMRLQGCISTSSSIGVAAAAVQLVAAGGLYFPRAAGKIEPLAGVALCNAESQARSSPLLARLTPRERAVLQLLEQGMANKIIAYRLSLSQSTVKAHVHSIISKLNVRNRTEAAVRATNSYLS